jgi:hypothetical protein
MRRDLNADLRALAEKHIAPIKAAAQRMFRSSDGKIVLDALERAFCDDLVPHDSTGAVDPNAVLIGVGSRRVIDYLRTLAEPKKEGQEP